MPLKMFEEKGESLPVQSIKQIIGIAAGKGGVGKSTVTVQLAHALKGLGFKVGILDADVYGPSIRKMVKEEELPYQEGSLLFPARGQGIKMISMAHFRKEQEAAALRAPIAASIVTQFLKNISWGTLDYLLIDFPPGTGDIQLTLCQQAKLTGAILVTTPQEVAVMDVRKAMHLFDQVQVPLLGVIENMSYYIPPGGGAKVHLFGEGGGKRLAEAAEIPFLGEIPLEPLIGQLGEVGRSIVDAHPENLAAQVFVELATFITDIQNHQEGVKHFYQKNAEHLTIEWEDGLTQNIGFPELQKKCPCARCLENQKMLSVKNDVSAKRIDYVGRYALKIEFTSGCSNGLYNFNLLRNM